MFGTARSLTVRGTCLAIVITAIIGMATSVACAPQMPEVEPLDDPDTKPPPKKKTPPESTKPPTTKSTDAGSTSSSSGDNPGTCETVAPNNKCGLDPQCGCEPTETCDVTNRTTGATSCVTGGSATLGRPCSITGDCMAGLGCIFGACRPYCKTPLDKCDVGGTELCVPYNSENPIPNLNFCTINCDPREPSNVCGTNSCHWFGTLYAPNKVSDCNFAGTKGELQPCIDSADCQPGLACVQHPSIGLECERWCRIGVPGDCGDDPAFTCKDVFGANAPVINGQKEGICQDEPAQ